MIVFADNDILLKLAGCNLLNDYLDLIAAKPGDIFLNPEARYSLPKQAKKKIGREADIRGLMDVIGGANEAPPVQSLDLLDRLSATVDTGEAHLLASACEQAGQWRIASGDKRAFVALLENNAILQEVVNAVSGRLYTLEMALLLLLDQKGFEYTAHAVSARSVSDSVLGMAFGAGRTKEHAIDCLSSNTRQLLPLLAHPHLVAPAP